MFSRALPFVIALSCLSAGCFGAHQNDDPGTETWPQWDTCVEALERASTGDTCDFDVLACGRVSCGPDGTRSVTCVDGYVQRSFSRGEWSDCETFLGSGLGSVGDFCDEVAFGTCERPAVDCCVDTFSCVRGVVTADNYCFDGCADVPLCEDSESPLVGVQLCETTEGCPYDTYCSPPGSPQICGVCFEPIDGCGSDGDCAIGNVCVSETQPCSCSGSANVCRPMCEPGSCEDGFFCASHGVCIAISCLDGFSCGPNLTCVGLGGGDAVVDEHGCRRAACALGSDCECGHCVEGECHSNLGVCEGPHP